MEEYPLSKFPLTRRVLEEQEPAVVNVGDPAADPHELRELVREGDKSLLMVPLVFRGESIGLVELMDHARERRYSRQELRICTAVAGQAAVALHNAQLFGQARTATREIDRLCEQLDAGRATRSPGSATRATSAALLDAAARAACELLGASSCVVSAARAERRPRRARAPAPTRRPAAGSAGWRLEAVAGAEVLTVRSAAGEDVAMTVVAAARVPPRRGPRPASARRRHGRAAAAAPVRARRRSRLPRAVPAQSSRPRGSVPAHSCSGV